MSARISIGVLIALCLTIACNRSYAQSRVAPTNPRPSILSFLGIPKATQSMTKTKDAVTNWRDKYPRPERKPLLKALTASVNLDSDNPGGRIGAGAELTPEKIRTIRRLAKTGCGCDDKEGTVTTALLDAMGDQVEDVRRAAIETVADGATSGRCEYCKQRRCCNAKITEQLKKIAYEQDETGRYQEPSPRVRRAAVEALAICRPSPGPIEEPQRIEPSIESTAPEQASQSGNEDDAPQIPRHLAELFENATVDSSINDKPKPSDDDAADSDEQPGAVVQVNRERKEASIRFLADGITAEPGTKLQVYQPEKEGYSLLGELEVIEIVDGSANVRPTGDLDLKQLTRGAVVVVP